MTKLRGKKHTIGVILECAVGFFWVANFRHFAKQKKNPPKKIGNFIFITNSLLFGEKKSSKNEKKIPRKLPKNRHNCLQCERVL
jgi:hypothetical protein